MSKQQSTVIWLGIVLIALNLVVNLSEVKAVLFGSATTTAAKTTANTPAGNTATSTQPANAATATPAANQITVT